MCVFFNVSLPGTRRELEGKTSSSLLKADLIRMRLGHFPLQVFRAEVFKVLKKNNNNNWKNLLSLLLL